MRTLTAEERQAAGHLKARLWLAVGQIVDEETQLLDPQRAGTQRQIKATPQFVASLVELVYNQCITLGEDLEGFARHAKRKTVTPDDMLMVARRNQDLKHLLEEYLRDLNHVEAADGEEGADGDVRG